jgi:hypothetical protein
MVASLAALNDSIEVFSSEAIAILGNHCRRRTAIHRRFRSVLIDEISFR